MIKRILYTTLVLIVLTMTVSITASAQEYIVKMKDNGVMLFSSDVEPLYAPQNLYVTDEETAKVLLESGRAERIAPNHKVKLFSAGYESLYSEEYTACPSLATINAEKAWNYETFGNEVKVGVIDSGCFAHSDITPNLLQGKNYTTVLDENDTDDTHIDGHGTHVSGIIATTANGKGTVGVAPKAKIVPLKCFPFAESDIDAVIAALYDAVDIFDCDIVNMSLGLAEDNELFREAVDYAYNKGVILVAAVGNDGNPTVNYPAGYDNVIGVGAVTDDRRVCAFSQKNNTAEIFAPGWNVNSLSKTEGGYRTDSGTSMACPYVSAAAAIALSFDPTLTPAEVRTLIINNTEPINGTCVYSDAGVLNIGKMVDALIKDKQAYTSPLVTTESGVTSTVFNLGASSLNASAIWYDKNSGGVTEQPFTISADGRATLTTPLTSARLFVWNSLNGMIPITQAR